MAREVVTIELTKDSLKTLEDIRRHADPNQFMSDIMEFFDRQASIGADFISDNYVSSQRLRRRSGNLAKAIIGRSVKVGSVPAMRIGVLRGPALRYAGVQEYGTKGKNPSSPYDTIRPKHAKALAIPQEPALTAAGLDRFGGPSNVPFDLKFIPFRGTGVAVGGLYDPRTIPQAGSGLTLQNAKMYYMLVREVDIEPKWYLRDGFDAWMPDLINELADWLRDYMLGLPPSKRKKGGRPRDDKGRFI
jgi:hypothetical protein